ncbi:MAG: c-type cytochrome [Gallionella sp.]|nr:c-type cytochrome [Gallionella sp.]
MSPRSVRTLFIAVLVTLLTACGKPASEQPAASGDKAAAETKIITSTVSGSEMPEFAKKKNCAACHAIDKKVVGPSWKDIAKKYKGDASAKARLITKMQKGGSGVWGAMPMPPTPGLSDAEASSLVDFIMGLAN